MVFCCRTTESCKTPDSIKSQRVYISYTPLRIYKITEKKILLLHEEIYKWMIHEKNINISLLTKMQQSLYVAYSFQGFPIVYFHRPYIPFWTVQNISILVFVYFIKQLL